MSKQVEGTPISSILELASEITNTNLVELYHGNFKNQSIEDASTVESLSNQDYVELNVRIGHRKAITEAAKNVIQERPSIITDQVVDSISKNTITNIINNLNSESLVASEGGTEQELDWGVISDQLNDQRIGEMFPQSLAACVKVARFYNSGGGDFKNDSPDQIVHKFLSLINQSNDLLASSKRTKLVALKRLLKVTGQLDQLSKKAINYLDDCHRNLKVMERRRRRSGEANANGAITAKDSLHILNSIMLQNNGSKLHRLTP